MAEKYYSWSPYVYVANNPLRFIDPDGMKKGDPDDLIPLPEVIITPSKPNKGDQALPQESSLWNLWYIFTGPRKYTPNYNYSSTNNSYQQYNKAYSVYASGQIYAEESLLVTGTPIVPSIGAGGSILKSIRSLGKARVFWSGGDKALKAAEEFALANGQTTLELTRAGTNLTKLTKGMDWSSQSAPLWARMSAVYAKDSVVHVFLHNPSPASMWLNIEKTILQNKNVKIIEHIVKS